MKLNAVLFAFLLGSAPLALVAIAPSAQAVTGDPLLVGSYTVAPGNPCNAKGPAGGLAANEAGRLYYGVRNQTRIWIQRSVVSATLPPLCLGSLVPAVSGSAGWSSLAYDATHAAIRLWGVRADSSGDVYGMSLTGAVLARFNHPGATGVAKDESASGHLLVATGSGTIARYAIAPATGTHPYAVSPAGTTSLPHGARAIAPWSGALLGVEGYTVRNYDGAGTPLGLELAPGYNYVDAWYQVQRASFWYGDVAFDTASYAGRGALWIMEQTGGPVCVANCPIYTCAEYEGSTCLRWICSQNCDPAGWTIVTQYAPSVRAIEVVRRCADGTTPAPTAPCLCRAPVPRPTFTSPSPEIHVRGAPTGTPASPATLLGGALAVTATGGAPTHRVTLAGPASGATGMGAATLVADASALGRGTFTFRASLFDVATNCQGGTAEIRVRVENPELRTFAQALRVEGNVPLNLVLASVPVAPLDTLAGAESAVVADPASASARHSIAARALEAAAAHAPVPGNELALAAEASARALGLAGSIDLAGLCLDLTADPACAALPQLALDEEILAASARVDASLATLSLSPIASVNTASGDAIARATIPAQPVKARATHAIAPCPLAADAHVATNVNGLGAPVSTPPSGTPCSATIGPFTVTLADTRATQTSPLAAEARATAVRITIAQGPYAGEIAIADAYAGITLDARAAPLSGPVRALDAPNDYATGADAPATSAGASDLQPGAYAGAFAGDDRADAFTVTTAPGKKLKVVLTPAHRVGAYATPAPTLPDVESAPRLIRLELRDPFGVLRDVSSIAVSAHPAEVELNVDETGAWSLTAVREDALVERAPYTIAISLTDVVMPDLDNGGANDAPEACAGAPTIPAQGVTHPMNAWESADTWALQVAAGESITATMAPLDPEGANFDLRVLDASCNVIASSLNGTGVQPKGAPEAIADLEVAAGTYYVQVVRANGIGLYALYADGVRDVPGA